MINQDKYKFIVKGYIIGVLLLQKKDKTGTFYITISKTTPKSISFIIDYIEERSILFGIDYATLDILIEKMEYLQSKNKKQMYSLFIITNFSHKNFYKQEQLYMKLISLVNNYIFLNTNNITDDFGSETTRIRSYINFIYNLYNSKKILYEEDKTKKYEGIII